MENQPGEIEAASQVAGCPKKPESGSLIVLQGFSKGIYDLSAFLLGLCFGKPHLVNAVGRIRARDYDFDAFLLGCWFTLHSSGDSCILKLTHPGRFTILRSLDQVELC